MPAYRKRRLNWAVSRNKRIKKMAPCRLLDGHVKEPNEMYIALGARLYVKITLFGKGSLMRVQYPKCAYGPYCEFNPF